MFPCGFVAAEEGATEKGELFSFFRSPLTHNWKVKLLFCPSFLFCRGMFAVGLLQLAELDLKYRKENLFSCLQKLRIIYLLPLVNLLLQNLTVKRMFLCFTGLQDDSLKIHQPCC